ATQLVTSQAKESSADGAEKQSQCDGGGDIGLGGVVIVGKLLGLDGEGVEVKGVRGPGRETAEKEDPALGREHAEKLEGILDTFEIPPLACGLAVLIANQDSPFPNEEILQGLLGRRDNAPDQRFRRLRSPSCCLSVG